MTPRVMAMVRPDWSVEAPPVVILALAAVEAPASLPAACAGRRLAGGQTMAKARVQAAKVVAALRTMLDASESVEKRE